MRRRSTFRICHLAAPYLPWASMSYLHAHHSLSPTEAQVHNCTCNTLLPPGTVHAPRSPRYTGRRLHMCARTLTRFVANLQPACRHWHAWSIREHTFRFWLCSSCSTALPQDQQCLCYAATKQQSTCTVSAEQAQLTWLQFMAGCRGCVWNCLMKQGGQTLPPSWIWCVCS